MGGRLARRLLDTRDELVVWNRLDRCPAARKPFPSRDFRSSGAAPESNRPSRGLHDRTGFEGVPEQAGAAFLRPLRAAKSGRGPASRAKVQAKDRAHPRSRIRRIVLLLESLNDYLAPSSDPRGWTAGLPAQPGPGPSRKENCHACDGVGRLRGSECRTCKGKRRQARPPPARGGDEASSASPRDLADDAHKWERARRRRDWSGSYKDLERALAQLRDADPIAHELVHAVYVEGRYDRLESQTQKRVASALLWLAQRLPAELRLPPHLEEGEQARERTIEAKRLAHNGHSKRAIKRMMGVRSRHLRRC